MADNEVAPSDYKASLAALILNSEFDLSSLRACAVLMLADLFRRDPRLRDQFLESLTIARTNAENEKSDAKVLNIDLAISVLQKIP